jgi:hypothetical protein
MSDNNSQDKPSFFDFAKAREWPPAESFPVEDDEEKKAEEQQSLEDFLSSENPGEATHVETFDTEVFPWELARETVAAQEEEKTPEEPKQPAEPLPDPDIDFLFSGEKTFEDAGSRDDFSTILEPQAEEPQAQEQAVFASSSNEAFAGLADLDFSFGGAGVKQETSEEAPRNSNFKAYGAYDYNDERMAEEFEQARQAEQEKKKSLEVNTQTVALALSILLVGGYLLFTKMFTRKYDTASSGREKRPAKASDKKLVNLNKELLPVWEVASQKKEDFKYEADLISSSKLSAGREDPFSIPDSVLQDMRKIIEAEIVKKQAPSVERKIAYRATLVGVLRSEANIVALIDLKQAEFEVIEGTTKPKIIKLAIKAMSKAKSSSLEMFVGEKLAGSWAIADIDPGTNSLSGPSVSLERGGDLRVLKLGRAVELGIFDTTGELYTFNDTETVSETEE